MNFYIYSVITKKADPCESDFEEKQNHSTLELEALGINQQSIFINITYSTDFMGSNRAERCDEFTKRIKALSEKIIKFSEESKAMLLYVHESQKIEILASQRLVHGHTLQLVII